MYFSSIDPSSFRPRSLICTLRRPRASGGVCSKECTAVMVQDSSTSLLSLLLASRASARARLRHVRPRPRSFHRQDLAALAAGQSVAVLDEPFLVVTFNELEVVDWSMASPAPVEAPVQRGGFRCPSSGMIRF